LQWWAKRLGTSTGGSGSTGRAAYATTAASPSRAAGSALPARAASAGPMVGAAGRRPRDLDRVGDAPPTACAEQPSVRERRQSVGMSRTDPRPLGGVGHASEPRPARTWVRHPAGGLTPARILNPSRGPENRAHRGGVAIPVAVVVSLRGADAETRPSDDRIESVRRSIPPDHGRVTGALGTGKAGIDDLEQVDHRPSRAGFTATLPVYPRPPPPPRPACGPGDDPATRSRPGRSCAQRQRATVVPARSARASPPPRLVAPPAAVRDGNAATAHRAPQRGCREIARSALRVRARAVRHVLGARSTTAG
jgi:hypothetical protein